jgi:hypothetical protein
MKHQSWDASFQRKSGHPQTRSLAGSWEASKRAAATWKGVAGTLGTICALALVARASWAAEPVYISDSLSTDGSCIFAEVQIERPAASEPEILVASGPNCSYRFIHIPRPQGRPSVYTISFRYETLDPQFILRTSFDILGWVTRARRHCFARRHEVACPANGRWEERLMNAHQLYTVNGTPAWVEDSDGTLVAPGIEEMTGRRYISVQPNGTVNITAKRPAL